MKNFNFRWHSEEQTAGFKRRKLPTDTEGCGLWEKHKFDNRK